MARKNQSNESREPGGIASSGFAGGVDPEDDVTSEISELSADEFDADLLSRESIETDITDADLSVHGDPDADETLAPGFLLNERFEIVELVHSGGMGRVYKAVDRHRHAGTAGQAYVAIKVLRTSLSHREDFRKAMEREATKAQALSHPNIINIFDFDEHDGRFFLVMEWLEGESVNSLLRRTSGRRLAPAFSWPIIEGAAEAIRHAHANNVVHADINPSNIFITTTHEIKLLDFGVARYTDELRDSDEDKVAWVTQTYASPEVLSGMTPGFEDDVFSLGCVAYRLLAGKHPFGGSPAIVARRNGVTVAPIPGLPEDDWRILRRSLAYARAERPHGVDVFVRDGRPADSPHRFGGLLRQALPVAATVVIALTAAWLFWPDATRAPSPGDAGGLPATDTPGRAPAVERAPPAADMAIGALLAAAAQAMTERRLVLPENDNARDLYRELLRLEPDNPEALRGLRQISDEFVGRADAALKAGNPRVAGAALAVAAETDAGNPAIDIVSGLLVAQGDAQLTAARLAAGDGDFAQASVLLDQAEQYTHIEPATIAALRERISREANEAEFLDRLAVADAHIAAGRLIWPQDANARAVLAGLDTRYGDDPRLRAARQRLAERLLTRAAFAATAGRMAEAEALIDEADSLGVLSTEIGVARSSLAMRSEPAGQPAGPATEPVVLEASPAEVDAGATEVRNDLSGGSGLRGDPEPSAAATDGAAGETRRATAMRMEDLGIERFVPPSYPRGAQRRGLTGFVDVEFDVNPDGTTGAIEIVRAVPDDVFDESAADAVRQWRFARRDDPVRANVTLRFEIAR